MSITVTNQKPAVLEPVHTISPARAYDPLGALRRQLVDPLFTPLHPASPALITATTGTAASSPATPGANPPPLTPDDVQALLLRCLDDTIDPVAEHTSKELLGQSLVHFDQATPLPAQELFAVQAAQRHHLPAPSARVVYSAATDVIPAAKGFLAGSTDEHELFASVAYTFHPHTLGFWFQSSAAFEGFRTWLAQQVQLLTSTGSTTVPAATVALLGDFAQLDLKGLTEALVLRRDDADGNEEFSFARTIVYFLMSYAQTQRTPQSAAPALPVTPDMGVLPFAVGELFCPRTIVLVNVEAHARATAATVTKEWDLITRSLASPVTVVSHTALSKLTALPRAAARAAAMSAKQQYGRTGRSAAVAFRTLPPTGIDLTKALLRVLRRMGRVNKSQNVLRTVRTSFLKANRRNPDDINKAGRMVSTQYLPDLHVYVDCSGSISEENYQETVMMLIQMAKKFNINLYFSSFSHVLSQEVLLKTANKSKRQIWAEFRTIPKVSGGTEFQQVWDYITTSRVRQRRLSLMITDFEWSPPSTREEHPSNLYYAPCSAMNWSMMVSSAEYFADAMRHIDPSIRQKLLGMIV